MGERDDERNLGNAVDHIGFDIQLNGIYSLVTRVTLILIRRCHGRNAGLILLILSSVALRLAIYMPTSNAYGRWRLEK